MPRYSKRLTRKIPHTPRISLPKSALPPGFALHPQFTALGHDCSGAAGRGLSRPSLQKLHAYPVLPLARGMMGGWVVVVSRYFAAANITERKRHFA